MPLHLHTYRMEGRSVTARWVRWLSRTGVLEADSALGRAARWAVSSAIRWSRYQSWFRRGFYGLSDLPSAFGYLPKTIRNKLQRQPRSIIVSALGLGETVNCLPFIKRLQSLYPHPIVVLSRNPRQALRLAESAGIPIIALPYLLTGWGPPVGRWLQTLRPALIVAMETLDELRHGMVRQAKTDFGTHLLIFNHNGNSGSAPDWRRLETDWECERILPMVEAAGVLSAEAAAQLRQLGLAAGRIERFPNLKFDVARQAAAAADPDLDRARLKLQPGEKVLIFGSVYPEEHDLLLRIYRKVLDRRGLGRTRLMIAPRYVATTAQILKKLAGHGLTGVRMTKFGDASVAARPIIVVDTAGELRRLYAIADVALVAGSLHPSRYGHNPIEPAAFGTAVIIGPYTSAFTAEVAKFVAKDAIIQLERPEEAADAIIRLLEDSRSCERLGRNALRVVAEESGAEDRYLAMIAALHLDHRAA